MRVDRLRAGAWAALRGAGRASTRPVTQRKARYVHGANVVAALRQSRHIYLAVAVDDHRSVRHDQSVIDCASGFFVALDAAHVILPLITPTTAESLTAPDLYKLQDALPPRWQARAQWCANLARINDARQFETANGALKFPSLQDNPPTLLGRPANELSNMDGTTIDATATASHYAWVYGSFADAFVIVERIRATTELITNLFGENRRPTGQRGVFISARTGAAVVVPQALRLLSIPTAA